MNLLYKNIKLAKSKNTLIQDETKLFSYIDSDFKSWNLNDKYTAPKIKAEIYEMTQDGTFKDIFKDPENQCMTQGQIIDFCKNYKDKLRTDGYGTLFLFKSNNEFFVASVHVDGVGSLRVLVSRFGFAFVYDASRRHRVVIPQLDSQKLSRPLALEDFDTLSSRLEKVENFISKLKELLNE